MGCCCPEYGGAEDPAGMWVFDVFGIGSRGWGGTVGGQECDTGGCRSWTRRMKEEERRA